MNKDYETELEQQVDRALRGLPDLEAPPELAMKVMAALATCRLTPWYLRPWQTWPTLLRGLAMAVLMGSFGGFVFAAWQLTQAAGYTETMEEVRKVFSNLAAIGSVLQVLLTAVVAVFKYMGTGFIIGCFAAAAIGYAMCIGLGTLVFRLVIAPNNHHYHESPVR